MGFSNHYEKLQVKSDQLSVLSEGGAPCGALFFYRGNMGQQYLKGKTESFNSFCVGDIGNPGAIGKPGVVAPFGRRIYRPSA